MKNILLIINDDRDESLAKNFYNSLKKFHTDEELEIKIVDRKDKKQWAEDPNFYYRAKALIAMEYKDEYDLIMVADADQICFGKLDYIMGTSGWDLGGVLNWNRVDPSTYGEVTVFNINPQDYFNAGFIAFRSKEVIEHLNMLCHGNYFSHPSMRYREQDLLNIIIHYGNYKVKCFDMPDHIVGYDAWHGLIAKGEGLRMYVKDGEVWLDPDDKGWPQAPKRIKLFHYAGGNNERKNHRLYFNEEMIKHIDWLISEEK